MIRSLKTQITAFPNIWSWNVTSSRCVFMLLSSLGRDEIPQVNKYCTDALYKGNNSGAPVRDLSRRPQEAAAEKVQFILWARLTCRHLTGTPRRRRHWLCGFSRILDHYRKHKRHFASFSSHPASQRTHVKSFLNQQTRHKGTLLGIMQSFL